MLGSKELIAHLFFYFLHNSLRVCVWGGADLYLQNTFSIFWEPVAVFLSLLSGRI